MKFLFVEIIFPLLVLLFLRSVLRTIFASFRSSTSVAQNVPSNGPPPVPDGGELKKDPVCGTYVSTVGGVSRKVNGHLVYFCSVDCRDKYRVA
jgi:YHS domain-containing protein